MKSKNILKIENYFEAFLIIFLIGIFFWLIKGFLMPIFLASTFVFLTYKPYKFLSNKTKSETISAIFMIFIILSLILLPTYLITTSLINETSNLYNSASVFLNDLNDNNCEFKYCDTVISNIKTIDFSLDKILREFSFNFTSYSSKIFSSLSYFVIDLFIFILSFFFLLKDGEKFLVYVKRLIPMKNEYKRALFIRFRDVSEAVFFNDILVAIIQGILLGIGFFIFNISTPIFWGFVATFFALLPMIGTALIWLPVAIFVYFKYNLLYFLGFMLYFILIVSFSDNFLRPLLLKKKIQIHPFIIFISILGGIEVFGFFGIFIGPIIISLLISVLQLYKLDFE